MSPMYHYPLKFQNFFFVETCEVAIDLFLFGAAVIQNLSMDPDIVSHRNRGSVGEIRDTE